MKTANILSLTNCANHDGKRDSRCKVSRSFCGSRHTQRRVRDIYAAILDAITTHLVAMTGLLFFYIACRGIIINRAYLDDILKQEDRLILAMNHVSYLDWIVIWAIFRYQYGIQITFLAKEKLFLHPIWGRIMRHVRCVRVSDDGRTIIDPTEKARLGTGIIGIFPEGRRSRDGQLQALRSGVAVMARRHQTPILPIALQGFYEAWRPNRSHPKPHPMRICIGSIIYPSDSIKYDLHLVQRQLHHLTTGLIDTSVVQNAYIDVDGTICDSTIADLLFYIKQQELSTNSYKYWQVKIAIIAPMLYALDKISRPLAQTIVYSMYQRLDPATIEYYSKTFYQQVLKKKCYEETLTLIKQLQAQGTRIILVSTNLMSAITGLAKALDAEAKAIDLDTLKSLSFRDRLTYLYTFKAKTMERYDTSNSLAIGDSQYDKPLFSACTISILKNRKSVAKKLAGIVQHVL